jgi:hypothetical protein
MTVTALGMFRRAVRRADSDSASCEGLLFATATLLRPGAASGYGLGCWGLVFKVRDRRGPWCGRGKKRQRAERRCWLLTASGRARHKPIRAAFEYKREGKGWGDAVCTAFQDYHHTENTQLLVYLYPLPHFGHLQLQQRPNTTYQDAVLHLPETAPAPLDLDLDVNQYVHPRFISRHCPYLSNLHQPPPPHRPTPPPRATRPASPPSSSPTAVLPMIQQHPRVRRVPATTTEQTCLQASEGRSSQR